jgi:iron complex outermembrane receptor protein
MVRAPKLTVNIGPSLQFASDAGKLGVSVLYYHSSGFFWNADNRLRQPAYDIVNGTLSWTSISERYAANLWVKNLLGAKYYSYAEEQTLGDNTSPAPPRTYGVIFSYRFH